jgi:hypothetical protein
MIFLTERQAREIAVILLMHLGPVEARQLTAELQQVKGGLLFRRAMKRLHVAVKNATFVHLYGGKVRLAP